MHTIKSFAIIRTVLFALCSNGHFTREWVAYFIEMLPASQFLQDVISDEIGIYPIFGFGVFRRSLDNISVLGSRNQPKNGMKTSRIVYTI